MGRITSDVGLFSGIKITDTINQLIAVAGRPRDLLVSRTRAIQSQQSAVGELTALVLGVQFAIRKLADTAVFETSKATSDSTALGVEVTGEPVPGSYRYTPVRTAQAQQQLSSGLSSSTTALGSGTFSVGYGGYVDDAKRLADLNGGEGVQRGKIRITDRGGNSATIDLTLAHSVDDVLTAINTNDDIDVRAETVGDSIRLVDNTGLAISNLRVQEVGGGTTAADLGLAGINVSASSATGSDISSLYEQLNLSRLNDGGGVSLRHGVADLTVTFRDGSASLDIDFNESSSETTLGDLLDTINAADPARLRAELSPDGDHLRFIDLTTDLGNTFTVTSTIGGSLAEDLQLSNSASGGVLTSERLLGGLKTTLLSSFQGGQGISGLGLLNLTDRDGGTASIDLSAAKTLDDVIEAINSQAVDITASINSSHSGILLTDTSGGSGNLIVANGDAGNAATKLGIEANVAQNSVQGTSLHLQTVGSTTLLSDFNGGKGVTKGAFIITDSAGHSGSIDLRTDGIDTLGDVIDLVNAAGIGVSAGLNSTGDGILLTDTAGGAGTLRVREVGSGTTASDLHLNRDAVGGEIDGTSRFTVAIDADDTLADLVTKLNNLGAGVAASVFNDGSGNAAYHLALNSQSLGRNGRIQVETSLAELQFNDLAEGRDALLLLGDVQAGGVLASSSTNTFDSVIAGASLTVNSPSATAATVTIAQSIDPVIANVKLFVQQYNSLRDKLKTVTNFNAEAQTTGVLFGSSEALRIDADLGSLISGRYAGAGSLQSFEALGVHVRDDGKLDFDEDKFRDQFAANPTAVREFFTTETHGAADKMDAVLEKLVGEDNSLLINRNNTLQRRIDQNNERIDFMKARLDRHRERLLIEFATLEQSLAKFQTNNSSIATLQQLAQSRTTVRR